MVEKRKVNIIREEIDIRKKEREREREILNPKEKICLTLSD